MKEELELREIFQIIRKRWKLLFFVPLLAVLIGGLYTNYFVEPTYKSSTTLMVLHSGEPRDPEGLGPQFRSSADIRLSRDLVKTYGEIVKSRRVAERAILAADPSIGMTHQELMRKIEVGLVSDTELIHITVSDTDPVMSAFWANTVTEAFIAEVVNIMHIENVNVLDDAIPALGPVSPRPMLNLAIAFILGAMVSTGLAFLLEYLDNTIKTPQDVINELELPVLGAVRDYSKKIEQDGPVDVSESRQLRPAFGAMQSYPTKSERNTDHDF